MVAAGVPGGVVQTDARNAFCAIKRAAMQRGLHRIAPKLLPAFDYLYGLMPRGAATSTEVADLSHWAHVL